MHHLSFPSKNPIFCYKDIKFSLQVFTFQNVYEPKSDCTSVSEEIRGLRVESTFFQWAGGQRSCAGKLRTVIQQKGNRYSVCINAEHPNEKIRCVKLTIHDIDRGKLMNLRTPEMQKQVRDIANQGEILRYPNGFEGLYTPLVVIKNSRGSADWFRSLDSRVRPKTFAILPHEDKCDVELIFEQAAKEFSKSILVPEWEVGFNGQYDQIMEAQTKWIAQSYHLSEWEERNDVPNWAKGLALVATIHCQHWTGYTFNTYEQVVWNMERIAKYVDPERVLIYLPGWEGRYYYNYGDFKPCDSLGGEEGFGNIMECARRLGMHVMPMFMINGANPHLDDFMIWGASSYFQNASGYPAIWGSCDWDESRHYDHNCGFPMNPGAPLWQDRLVDQVNELIRRYHFDAVFMDLAAVYSNDRRFDVYDGVVQVACRIREKHPEILMSGEGWFDALSAAYPLTQPSLTEDGDTRWSDRPYLKLFTRFNRCFGHLGMGDVSRSSTGVFEFGYNYSTKVVPLRKGIIPTITIVDGTLEKGQERSMEIFDQANQYIKLFL